MHGENQRSLGLNPVQKDLVLKIAELLCNKDTSDGRAKYWVEKAARLLPRNPAALRLKVNSSFSSLLCALEKLSVCDWVLLACHIVISHKISLAKLLSIRNLESITC